MIWKSLQKDSYESPEPKGLSRPRLLLASGFHDGWGTGSANRKPLDVVLGVHLDSAGPKVTAIDAAHRSCHDVILVWLSGNAQKLAWCISHKG